MSARDLSAAGLATGLLLGALCMPAAAGVTSTVVDIPVTGATQRFLYVKPDAPIANIVNVPGGDGVLGIQNDGSMTTVVATCSPIGRNRQAFAERGYALALVDQTSTGSVGKLSDVLEVVKYMQARHNVPTFVVGGSSSTPAIANLAANLPAANPAAAAIFLSPDVPDDNVPRIKIPTLIVYHFLDPGQFATQFNAALTGTSAKEMVQFTAGTVGKFCSYHAFNGLDPEFVTATSNFINKYAATAQPATPLSFNLNLSKGWNLLGNSLRESLAVATQFGDASKVNAVWKWDAAAKKWWFYSPTLDAAGLQSYATSKGYGVLAEVKGGEGYWVQTSAATSLSLSGTAFSLTSSALVPGWNLVAHGADVSAPAFNISLSATPPIPGVVPQNFKTLWAWDSVAQDWYFYAPSLDAQGGTSLKDYITANRYLDFFTANKALGIGTGFWVNLP